MTFSVRYVFLLSIPIVFGNASHQRRRIWTRARELWIATRQLPSLGCSALNLVALQYGKGLWSSGARRSILLQFRATMKPRRTSVNRCMRFLPFMRNSHKWKRKASVWWARGCGIFVAGNAFRTICPRIVPRNPRSETMRFHRGRCMGFGASSGPRGNASSRLSGTYVVTGCTAAAARFRWGSRLERSKLSIRVSCSCEEAPLQVQLSEGSGVLMDMGHA
mmetsp:Transcript_1820/g.3029  ORF Transcript_1820/g.3029 Transcript_1820/m.3029 type:complete len:220 (-) Transcript_1820:200-859(-)